MASAQVNDASVDAMTGARITPALINHAGAALERVLRFEHPADAVLSRYFREHRKLGHRDRGFIAENVYSVVRRLAWVDACAGGKASARQRLLTWLSRGLGWSRSRLEALVSPGEFKWLAEARAASPEALSFAEQLDFPQWLVDRLEPVHGEQGLRALAAGLNEAAPLDVRANLLKISRNKLLAAFHADGIEAEACRFSPHGVRLAEKPALNHHALFQDGQFEVQDEGSQLLALLVQPRRRELIVDFCAGAGGKTLHLGAMMRSTGGLYAVDVSDKRLANLKPRAARAGLSNIHPVAIAHENDAKIKRLAGKADRVLVDAPCSGLGTLRRNPDLKWRQSPDDIDEMVARQRRILSAAARLVRPGGRLVYATCSVLAEENDAVVDAFIKEQPQFHVLNAAQLLQQQGVEVPGAGERLQLFPHLHATDGFYAAVLERESGK